MSEANLADVIERIRAFLVAHLRDGYAAGGRARRLPDGSHRIRLEGDGIAYDDTWVGGDPFGGRILVSVDGRPTWTLVYYGAVIGDTEEPSALYRVLREALLAAPEAFPVRGPAAYEAGGLRYRLTHEGSLDRFVGRETIERGDRAIYSGMLAGGLVDRRGG